MADRDPVDRDELAAALTAAIRPKLLERLSIEPMDAHMLAAECTDEVLTIIEQRFATRFARPS